MAKTLLGAGLAFGAVASAVVACSSDHYVDDGAFCVNNPTDRDCAGRSGSGGAGGASGMGGAPMNGTGGAPMSGMGGGGFGGSGGGGTCIEDLNCNAVGEGSLCVNTVCTAPATTCALGTLVVVDKAFSGDVVGAPLGACYFRSLDEAVAKVAPGTTKVLSVYAAAAGAKAPLDVTGLTFEGHGTTTSQPVTLTVTPAGTAPLVRLGEGSLVRGFALSGAATQKGFGILSGAATLEGPLTVSGFRPGLSVEGSATVTVRGAQGKPVKFSANAVGVRVEGTAGLAFEGDADEESAVVESTNDGAGVLVLSGSVDAPAVALDSVTFRSNQNASADGAGALEIRQNRQVTVQGCLFKQNQQSITLNGESTPSTTLFAGVTLTGNDFSQSFPGVNQGSIFCGSTLGSNDTALNVGVGNTFPQSSECSALSPTGSCSNGAEVGFDTPGKALKITCAARL